MKTANYISFLLLLFLFDNCSFFAQTAFIYQDSVLLQTKGFATQKAKHDSLQTVYSQELKTLRERLDAKLQTLTAVYAPNEGETSSQLKQRMKPEDAQKLAFLEEENKLLDMRFSTYQQALEQNYNSELKPILETIDRVMKAYAKKHTLDMILIMEEFGKSVAYFNPGNNITQPIIRLVNEQLTH